MKISTFKAKIIYSPIYYLFLICLILFFLTSCGPLKPKKTDLRKIPGNPKDKREKNIREGKAFRLGGLGTQRSSGNFQFASSNEMWRATIEILDFVPLSNADYGGGVVITDWYNDGEDKKESIKIMVQFLSNEIRADGLKVVVYNRYCIDGNTLNCETSINKGNVSEEIKFAILKKASTIKNFENTKKAEEYRKKNPTRPGTLKSP